MINKETAYSKKQVTDKDKSQKMQREMTKKTINEDKFAQLAEI